jgi:hypothetical protein
MFCSTLLYTVISSHIPFNCKPFYNPALTGEIYFFCMVRGGIGVFLYACILIIPMFVKSLKKLK